MKKKNAITQADLNQAIRKFLKSGGVITKLPDQKNFSQRLVGGKWCTTEMGSGLQS